MGGDGTKRRAILVGVIICTLVVAIAGGGGCVAANGGGASEAPAALAGTRQERVERLGRVAAPVVAAAGVGRRVRLLVLDTPRFGAFAFPDGRVYVSRGLADALDDSELAAAVAHELGHLHAPATSTARGLAGSSGASSTDNAHAAADADEIRADEAACVTLRNAGIHPGALAGALRKLRDSRSTDAEQDERLDFRIRLLPTP